MCGGEQSDCWEMKNKLHEYDIVTIGLSQMSRTVRRARKDSSVQTWNSELTRFIQEARQWLQDPLKEKIPGPDGGLEPLPPLKG